MITDHAPFSDIILEKIQKLATTLQLDNTSFVLDVIVDENHEDIKAFIEINPRSGAGTPAMFDLTHGTDIVGLITRISIGEVKPQEVEALTKHTEYMHIKYITPKV